MSVTEQQSGLVHQAFSFVPSIMGDGGHLLIDYILAIISYILSSSLTIIIFLI